MIHDDLTLRFRVIILRTHDDRVCFGCGGTLPLEARGRGTSRYSSKPTVHLCSQCCIAEAFNGDCFLVKAMVAEAERRGFLEPAGLRWRARQVR